MHIAAEAAQLQQAAVTNLFFDTDRVMIDSRSLDGATYMTKATFTARRRGTWLPVPRYEPTGVEVYRAATNAATAARLHSVATAAPNVAPSMPSPPTAVHFTQGRIAAVETTTPSATAQLLTREPPFGMGTGGLESRTPGRVCHGEAGRGPIRLRNQTSPLATKTPRRGLPSTAEFPR